jgi:GH15 family glucan-1,4-alpha-glucosidase
LVGRNGSIDWLCWPAFVSAACFAPLLGEQENGRWLIAKDEPIETARRCRSGTLILETRFETGTGSATLVDFMDPREGGRFVRILFGEQGRVDFRTEFVVRFNYGATGP